MNLDVFEFEAIFFEELAENFVVKAAIPAFHSTPTTLIIAR